MVNPMCDYFGCIITKDLKVHWSKRTFAHEDLLSELKLEDKNLEAREFIRVEILPNDKACMTRNREDWTFKVDEVKTLPNWYEKNVIQCRKLCWEAWEQSVQVNLALGKEEKTVTDTMIEAYGSSKVVAHGSSNVVAYGSSKVVAYDFSKVVAYGSSKVVAHDSSTVEAYGSSKVVAHGSSTVEAYGSSTVEAYGSSKVVAHDSSNVVAHGSSTVEAYDSSTVEAYGSSKVVAYGSSTVEAHSSSTVEAHGSSTVEAHDFSKVEIKSDTTVVLCHQKIFVSEKATVVRASIVKAAEV
jgi:hypothetical protein